MITFTPFAFADYPAGCQEIAGRILVFCGGVFTGANGILETLPQGDDVMFSSKDDKLMEQYAPTTHIGNGVGQRLCVSSGANNFIDSIVSRRDEQVTDPNNPMLEVIMSGPAGRCSTDVNDDDIEAPSRMRNASSATSFAGQLQTYLNNSIWLKQANVNVTVDTTVISRNVNFDLNRDKKLQTPVGVGGGQAEASEISNMINHSDGTYSLFFTNLDMLNNDVLGYVESISGVHSFYGKNFWDGGDNKRNHVIAHEIGHLFGSPHTVEKTATTEVKEFYKRDVMYFGTISTLDQCRVRKPQWDKTKNLPMQ